MSGNQKSALICGSVAYDTIMVFPDRFKTHILPDKLHMLNVAFLVPQMRREFGGCAGNIAYNLKLLGDTGYPMGGIGSDFAPYREWMNKVGVSGKYLVTIPEEHCAQAFITTDLDANQITAFHPGAMNHSARIKVPPNDGISIGVVAPDSRQGMLEHAEQFKAAGIPFIFDPGQAMPLFAGDDFKRFISIADWLALNDYEWHLLQERTGWSAADCLKHVKALIITKGGDGSEIHANGRVHHIPCAKAREVVDPTGCGDAYRAGLIHGILRGLDWETTGRIASLMGAIKIAVKGTQNHSFTLPEFAQLYAESFGERYSSAEERAAS
ncbi:MAG TPA: carbohydrate kinase family protein [Steroidobacteraceae bacterium]|nr:carbohydrate kinase family protein [Steroidobacteraceae bacterium]